MTTQFEIIDNLNYIPVLDHGFCGLIETLGSDDAVCDAARVSYGAGTRSSRDNRGLIRYLVRNGHTSPLEMTAIKLHVKAPIFVLRQMFRHRTHSANENSARYSIMSDEFYLPSDEQIKPQSQNNKQGRAGEIDAISKHGVRWIMQTAYENAYAAYNVLLGEREGSEEHYNAYSDESPLLSADFPGIARELARSVIPVAVYSEMYWQQSLHNMFHLIKLRSDNHAQYEIRQYANAIYELIKPKFPICCEAFDDYVRNGVSLSHMELILLKEILTHDQTWLKEQITNRTPIEFASAYNLTLREAKDFCVRFDIDF
jgi:thymidylate synthase (FAD)